jgi:hypothetical protein
MSRVIITFILWTVCNDTTTESKKYKYKYGENWIKAVTYTHEHENQESAHDDDLGSLMYV